MAEGEGLGLGVAASDALGFGLGTRRLAASECPLWPQAAARTARPARRRGRSASSLARVHHARRGDRGGPVHRGGDLGDLDRARVEQRPRLAEVPARHRVPARSRSVSAARYAFAAAGGIGPCRAAFASAARRVPAARAVLCFPARSAALTLPMSLVTAASSWPG